MKKRSIERHFWNYYAKSYDNLAKHYEPYKRLMGEVCQHIDNYADGRPIEILDAGCGTGNYVVELMKSGHRITGIDNSDVMLSMAKSKITVNNENHPPKILTHDLNEPLPFENNSFNAVISIHSLFTLEDHEGFISELKRVASRSSLVIIVNSCDKLKMREAIGKQLRMAKGFESIRSLKALFMVGFWNLILSFRQSKNYRITTEEEIIALLESVGANNIKVSKTYVSSIIAVADIH